MAIKNIERTENQYSIETYRAHYGEFIGVAENDLKNPWYTKALNKRLYTAKVTAITLLEPSIRTTPAQQDALEDFQNDLFWSSYDVLK